MHKIMTGVTENFQVFHSVASPLASDHDMVRRGSRFYPGPASDTTAFVSLVYGRIQGNFGFTLEADRLVLRKFHFLQQSSSLILPIEMRKFCVSL